MNLRPHILDGYRAARFGRPLATNPWQPDTIGGHAWALGWRIGSMPWYARWLLIAPLWVRR